MSITRTFKHSGDRGDIIYSLPAVKIAGGGDFYLSKSGMTRVQTSQETFDALEPLLKAQPYITSVELYRCQSVAFDLDLFRTVGTVMENIAVRHLRAFGFPESEAERPWLEVEPDPIQPVVINRTARYRNPEFPWKHVVETYKHECVFVGLPEEHSEFCGLFGEVPYWPTANLLELAKVIAGCEIFIGNQSLPGAIAEGLKKTVIQEVFLQLPNCRFNRNGFYAVCGGHINLPKLPNWVKYRTKLYEKNRHNLESQLNDAKSALVESRRLLSAAEDEIRYLKVQRNDLLQVANASPEAKPVQKKAVTADTCIVQLGRYGDILNILPVAKDIADKEGACAMVVQRDYADLLEGVSYINTVHVWDGDFALPSEAVKQYARQYKKVYNTQVYDKNVARPRICESFNMESWRYGGFLHLWSKLPLVIDQRSKEREAELLKSVQLEGKRFLLVNVFGHSSPFANAEQLLEHIRAKWSDKLTVVDMRRLKAKKFQDLLGLLDTAVALVSIDTSTLHLAAASQVPVIALITDNPDHWHGTKLRCNTLLSLRYREYEDRKSEIDTAIETALAKPSREPKLVHVWCDYPVFNVETKRRMALAHETWKTQYAKGGWVAMPVKLDTLPRKFTENYDRQMPYIRDLLNYGEQNAPNPDDIIVMSNADVCLTDDCARIIRAALEKSDAAYSFRVDFKRLDRPLTRVEVSKGEKYSGVDLVAMRASFWRANSFRYPDMLMASEAWDWVVRVFIDSLNPPRRNAMQEVIYHERHPSLWEIHRKTLPSQVHNRKLAKEYLIKMNAYGGELE